MDTGSQRTVPDSDANLIQALSKFQAALIALMTQPFINDVINDSSRKVARDFNIDEAALAIYLSSKLPFYLATINTGDPQWQELISRWCKTVAENHGLNLLKHKKKTEKNFANQIIHLNSGGKRNGRRVLTSNVPTPEDQLSQKEQAVISEARAIDMRSRVRAVITEDVVIAKLWIWGYDAKEIAKILNKPVKTVYGKISKMHKAVIKEIGFTPTEENKGLMKAGLRDLIANSLQGIALDSPYLDQTPDISGELVN